MEIELVHLSKRYGYQWILKDVNLTFSPNEIIGIAGRNGSGKSTLIKLISGMVTPSEGRVIYLENGKSVSPAHFYKYFSWVAPYTDLIQEFSLKEMFHLHAVFKSMRISGFDEFLQFLEWADTREKPLKFYSSGMKQKLQLALALLSNTPILLLDEPTSYLDEYAKNWFAEKLGQLGNEKIILISSNDSFDLQLCQKIISLQNLVHPS